MSKLLSPRLALLWLRSRLSTEDKEFNDTLLTVTWWQRVLMRVLPLALVPRHLPHRLRRGPPTKSSQRYRLVEPDINQTPFRPPNLSGLWRL